MSVGIVSLSGSIAGAKGSKPPPNPPVQCTVSATVTFAAPGISTPGSISTSKDSTTSTSDETFGPDPSGCTGTGPALSIVAKSTKCSKTTPGQPSSNSACEPGNYGYDSWTNYANSGASTLQKAVKKLSFTINGIAYSSKTTSAAAYSCSGGEVGFKVTGTVSAPKADKGQSAVLIACLGATTGTGTSSNCQASFVNCVYGPGYVATAKIDPTTSSIAIDE